jgi:acyl dehydratase
MTGTQEHSVAIALPSRSGTAAVPGRGRFHATDHQHQRSTQNMIVAERASDFAELVGKEIGISEWITIDQEMIDTFARVTGDDQWIHVDVERARAELPEGRTIAHGYLVISMLPRLSRSIYRVRQRSRGINYGSNRVRFITPVLSGSRVRARQKVLDATKIDGGMRITMESTVEIEGASKPALVAETVAIIYDAAS